ncbi:hypothetical protein EUX98_g897 [Antrodiella citrinella]|uniref:BZIP domain-containing protein n=1 Tax=Antrodiella citrinella TaxID=2447956 RepID=A0A4S4N532_9APHY|nr:hypothetical protein EUX98_g897 [Antrodiella citrinella]
MLAHPPFHQQPQQQQQAQQQQQQPPQQQQQSAQQQLQQPPPPPPDVNPALAQPQPPGTFQTLRLRDDPPPVTQPAPRSSRKRKSPPTADPQQQQQQPLPPTLQQHPSQQPMSGLPLPSPHTMVHPMGPPPLPHGYQYVPSEYPPGAIPQMPPAPSSPGQTPILGPDSDSQAANANRTLSQSKRAEQNRKAQRAFRERRDQYVVLLPFSVSIAKFIRGVSLRHVKALESRSQLLDAALASADEANRRWEECRALVDQLRIENAALRSALNQAQIMNGGGANGTENNAQGQPPEQSGQGGGGENKDGNVS